ncbi:hypothetical protein MYX65_08155 [Acidobacteria bacterium AH-259-L09]|nr:hypothetical protein [Acidobacteria bacterium AH-259-L09]
MKNAKPANQQMERSNRVQADGSAYIPARLTGWLFPRDPDFSVKASRILARRLGLPGHLGRARSQSLRPVRIQQFL